MIYRLQRKFILISAVSIFLVVTLIFGTILMLNISSMNKNMDILADSVSEGGGRFPSTFADGFMPGGEVPPRREQDFDFITPETPFSTRHFTVIFDRSGEVAKTFTESIYSITDDEAVEYAKKVIGGRERGWILGYRYKVFSLEFGNGVVFIDGSMRRSAMLQSTVISGVVLFVSAALVLGLIFIFSKKAVKPISESYEKQKQFVTDANHELKTPLTLILTNLDIAESELGQNEWLDDIRAEGHRMAELINELGALSRMDEDWQSMNIIDVPFGEIVYDTVSEFEALAKDRGKQFVSNIDRTVVCKGDEAFLYRLVGILLDNAIKYCDQDGEISITLRGGRKSVLTVENTYSTVSEIELHRLFDRFYRADKARRFTGGYGVGLSMAKVIAEKHGGEIFAYKKDELHIGFKVIL